MPERLDNLTSLDQKGGPKVSFERQLDWYNPKDTPNLHVSVVGVGGIGSLAAILISKLGIPKMTLIDPDTFEAHNIPNQFAPIQSVGQAKAKVIGALCRGFGVAEVTAIVGVFRDYPYSLNGVVVTGLDSMAARKNLWNTLRMEGINRNARWLVDGRLNGLEFTVWTVNTQDAKSRELYEQNALYTDEEGDSLPCTGRGVIDVSALIAGTIARQVRLIATKQEVEPVISFAVNPRMGIYVPSYEVLDEEKKLKEQAEVEATPIAIEDDSELAEKAMSEELAGTE